MSTSRKKPTMQADASVYIAVNVPAPDDATYKAHAKRAVKLLTQGGYEAHAMTADFILQAAEGIARQVAETQQAERLLAHAAANRPQTDDDRS